MPYAVKVGKVSSVADLTPLFNPKSVAIIGASNNPEKLAMSLSKISKSAVFQVKFILSIQRKRRLKGTPVLLI
ncbi:hypothetical protein N752_13145 [Desulforamulus aquiferis]|nr:hypothetical protein N752_13145 [Desulforamulus aquiferis]